MITHLIDDPTRFIPPVSLQSSDRSFGMIRFFAVGALATIGLLAGPAQAEMSAEAARAGVTPFYQALNAEFAKDSADLIRQATAPDWVSCRGNNVCNTRDEVIAAIGQR